MDDEDNEECPFALQSRKFDDNRNLSEEFSRKTLVQAIDDKLEKYGQFVWRYFWTG